MFRCHKSILSARSDYLKSMLAGDNVETKNSSMDVREEDIPAKTIEKVLNYIYLGEIPSENNIDISLLNAANMYLLDELKEVCVTKLVANLAIPNCVSTFVAVDRYLPEVYDM